MNRTFAIVAAISFLCVAQGALALVAAVSSTAPAGDERPLAPLARDWARFSPADRASCLSSTGSSGAYTDLLNCLEIKRDARLPKPPGMPATVGEFEQRP